MDFHAWFEAYVGGRWYAFDARHNVAAYWPRGRRATAATPSTSPMVTQYGAMRLNR